jgi:sulfate adenylyltransferase subunit 2
MASTALLAGRGADEEKSRSKERIFSLRGANFDWDPRRQRPEFWSIYNTQLSTGTTLRIFPLSNWTEVDIWDYILLERIEVTDLYLSKPRQIVKRAGSLILRDDERLKVEPGEVEETMSVRFRTLGCYPLTGGC